METEITPESKKLDYSPPDARQNKRWVIIALFIALLSFPILIEIKQVAVYWRNRLQNISAQHRCLTYTQSPGTVVYEEEPSAAAKLAGGKLMGEGWSTLSTTGQSGGTILGYSATSPQCFRQIAFPGPALIADSQSFFRSWGFAGVGNFVYLGGRSTATGPERLIYVSLNSMFSLRQGKSRGLSPGPNRERSVINWFVIQPATWTSPMKIVGTGMWGDLHFWINMPWPMRMYAGRSDPNDTSRFSIPYRTPEGAFAVDAQLLPNDQLSFSRRRASSSESPMP